MSGKIHIPAMKPTPASSNVAAIGHDAAAKRLHVLFKNGGHYVYEDVDDDTHARAMKSPSLGKFIASEIRGKYRHHKLAD